MLVKDMTVQELEQLIRRVVGELTDPDDGLELTDELREYLETHADDTDTVAHEEIVRSFEAQKHKMVKKGAV
ncbi:MAG: hypothetical protein HQL03_00715 [Nitrospirae bacterium]|nr:hypothetical protein [Nitrospirota bacterium]